MRDGWNVSKTDHCGVGRGLVAVSDSGGEEGAESGGRVLDLPINLRSHPHLCS